ncbi:MAG TPA: zinc ABC transporter substrate-binding protein, partial [Tissierellales bacterium]|nr:zinc ABC transporter substrate-binding protein [Tissierellales bacterium]
EIVKDKGEIDLLLPPGVEAHSYEPTPQDISKIKKADVFIYTGEYMEPWAEKVIKNVGEDNITVVDLSEDIELIDEDDHEYYDQEKGHKGHENDDGHHHGGKDPHIWLNPVYAQEMVDNIVEAVVKVDKNNEDFYRENGDVYKEKLAELDKKFTETFEKTEHKTIIYGGHFAFGYFAKRYGLDYISPYNGFTPNAEPTPQRITELIQNMKSSGMNVIYYEELIDPKIAKIISEQTEAEMMLLHGAHNVSKEELESGISYIEIMEDNLEKLKQGLLYDE